MGLGWTFDLYGFLESGSGWASCTQPKPKVVDIFGRKCLLITANT